MGSIGKSVQKIGDTVLDPLGFGSDGKAASFLGIGGAQDLGSGGNFAMSGDASTGESEAIARLRLQASGGMPSITELQYRQALDDMLKQQQAATASARGVSNVGLLQRNATMAGTQAGMDMARETAAAKLAEQRSADQGLIQAAAAQRGVAFNAANTELSAENQAMQNRATFFGNLGSSASKVASGGAAHGGQIPGEAIVPGDSPVNDTEPYNLSPGEIVIPRSAAQSRDKAIEFLDAIKFNKEGDRIKEEDIKKGMARFFQLLAEK